MRGEIWKLICKVHYLKQQYSNDVYSKFLAEEHPQLDNKIQRDIHRTLPGSKEFSQTAKSGENRLYNVLKAYTSYDPQIGYCQGMNFIAVTLLSHMQSEEDAFWALVYVMHEKGWRDIFNQESNKIALLLKDLDSHFA
jgi:hypothetical protein